MKQFLDLPAGTGVAKDAALAALEPK